MTFHNDPNINRRQTQPVSAERSYTGWIVGAVVALAVVLGIFAMSGRSTDKNSTASNPPSTPATTGSATSTPSTTTVPKSDPAPAAPQTTPAPAR